jgi:hypothetical protein
MVLADGVDGRPVFLEAALFCPGVEEGEFFTTGSLRGMLESKVWFGGKGRRLKVRDG